MQETGEEAVRLSPPDFRVPAKSYRHVLLEINHKTEGERGDQSGARTEGQTEAETETLPDTKKQRETGVPVVMQVKNGRALRLLLQSKRVESNTPCLFSPPVVPVGHAPTTTAPAPRRSAAQLRPLYHPIAVRVGF